MRCLPEPVRKVSAVPDVVLMDLWMPGSRKAATTRWAKVQSRVRTLVLTTYGPGGLALCAVGVGAADHLVKHALDARRHRFWSGCSRLLAISHWCCSCPARMPGRHLGKVALVQPVAGRGQKKGGADVEACAAGS